MTLNSLRDSKGRFVKGNIPWHKKTFDEEKLIELYEKGYSVLKISRLFGYKGENKRIFSLLKSLELIRPMGFQKGHPSYLDQDGEKNHRWKGGFTKRHGYTIMLYKGKQRQYHHYIWCIENGIPFIPKGYVVHHRNMKRDDNRPENLLLVPNDLHTKWHTKLRCEI